MSVWWPGTARRRACRRGVDGILADLVRPFPDRPIDRCRTVDPSHPLARLLEQDQRYTLDAYLFVLEALTYAQEAMGLGAGAAGRGDRAAASEEPPADGGQSRRGTRPRQQAERHVSGQQLCEAARLYGQQQYGFLAPTVLSAWGIRRTADWVRSSST